MPNINSTFNSYAQAAAERQAINSTVQGSAADLVKRAMLNIQSKLAQKFPRNAISVRESSHEKARHFLEEGASFILQLHDELYYEVVAPDVVPVAKIVKECMENVTKLRVPFPVKIRIGPSWGDLVEMSNYE